MQVKNRIFPYPVLNNDKNFTNFQDADFQLVYAPLENEYNFVLSKARFETNSKLINDLFDEEKIKVVVIVECSNTVYRKCFEINKEGVNIVLPKVDFTEKVDISMFAYVVDSVTLSSDEYEDDYHGIPFELEKYDIVAANDGFNVRFKHEEMEDNLAQSIFSIIVNHDLEQDLYVVECNIGRKIAISLSESEYSNYKIIYTVPIYKEVFFNMLLIPALIEGLTLCKNVLFDESKDLEDVGNQYSWFRSIQLAYKKLKGLELSLDEFKNVSPVLLAQELLGKPLGKSLKKLVNETNKIENGEIGNE